MLATAMPLCFAYGSNMDRAAMAARCPASKPLGPARLMRYRFAFMADGHGTVAPDPGGVVHGVLWDLALADMRALDAYEEVARGLYRKVMQPVLRAEGGSARALVYVGRADPAGRPRPGYLEGVIAAARDWSLPPRYIEGLERLLPRPSRAAAQLAPDASVGESPRQAGVAVRPRFATPFDRRD
jgi:hypothetical protein